MKAKKLVGLSLTAAAMVGFVMSSGTALATTKHHTTASSCAKEVRCYEVNGCKDSSSCKTNGYILVSKSACEQLSGTTTKPTNTSLSNTNSTNPNTNPGMNPNNPTTNTNPSDTNPTATNPSDTNPSNTNPYNNPNTPTSPNSTTPNNPNSTNPYSTNPSKTSGNGTSAVIHRAVVQEVQ